MTKTQSFGCDKTNQTDSVKLLIILSGLPFGFFITLPEKNDFAILPLCKLKKKVFKDIKI
jgi:hypothetical protein